MSPVFIPHYEWAALLAAMFCLWGFLYVKPNYGSWPAAFLMYLGLSAVWVWVWVENRYYTVNPYDQMALRYFSVDSLARLLMIIVPCMAFVDSEKFIPYGKNILRGYVILNSLFVLASLVLWGCKEENVCGGGGNPSIMVGLSMCALPIIVRSWSKDWYIVALASLAALASHSSVAVGLLGIYYAYSLLLSGRYLLAAFLSPLPIAAAYFVLGNTQLFSSNGRIVIWKYMMDVWATPKNFLTGMGWGTYHIFSINLQAVKHVADGSYWNTFHNDWLQMIFEGGAVAGVLMIGTYFTALGNMLRVRDAAMAMSIVLYGLYMGANPALHFAFPVAFGAWLFVYALKRDRYENQKALY